MGFVGKLIAVAAGLLTVGLAQPLLPDSRLTPGDVLEVVPFDVEQSELAAFWYARRRLYNLSLG